MTGEQAGRDESFGVVGLGVMGTSLALNLERNGWSVSVWDREAASAEAFARGPMQGRRIASFAETSEMVASLGHPRRILIMVKAGSPVDWTIGQLLPHLQPGDVLVDGGNSHFEDTRRRQRELLSRGIHLVGAGVSGGQAGALLGPSLMPGGDRAAYEAVRPALEAIAAQVADGPCVTHVGPDGAGHFVKMVHNGIEYGDMQLIAEAYDLLQRIGGLRPGELAELFAGWNEGPLESYLIEITSRIFDCRDNETGRPLVELVLDKAGQKGTGRWTAFAALDLGVAIPTIHAAIDARILSGLKDERVRASERFAPPSSAPAPDRPALVRCVHDALLASKLCCYAQGMALIRAGSLQHGWGIDLSEMARIWKGGCIIRARLLDDVQRAYRQSPELSSLLMDGELGARLIDALPGWREAIALGVRHGAALPATSASLAYFDTYRCARLPLNLTQAQRDYFGAHHYERIDRPELGPVHSDWGQAGGAA
jgi:6-phosphogluconate dehydrogenase